MEGKSSKSEFKKAGSKNFIQGRKNYIHPDLHRKIETYKKLINRKDEQKKLDDVFKDHQEKMVDQGIKDFVQNRHFWHGVKSGIHRPEQIVDVKEAGKANMMKLERESLKKAKNILHRNYNLSKNFKVKTKSKTKERIK